MDIEDIGEYYFPVPSIDSLLQRDLIMGEYGYEREEIPEDASDPYRIGVDERDTFNDGDMDDVYSLDNRLSSDDD